MTERRKIAVVIPKYGLVGGAEGFAAELTERIAALPRFDVHVFAQRWAALSGRVTFHRIPRLSFPRSLGPPAFAWFVRRAIAAAGPFDLVHTHDRIFAADVYTLHGVPHRWWIRQIRQKRLSLFDRAQAAVEDRLVLAGGCRRFLAVAELTRDIFLAEYPAAAGRVSVIHPGIDATAYAARDREACRREIRGRFGIGAEEPLILFVAMNFAVKGLDHVLRGLARLWEQAPQALPRLLVVGRGDERAYSRLARELGIADRVHFAGPVDRDRLPAYYLAGDLYAMLSRFDTFGLVVLEAMAAGLPVLVSGNVGARDLVREGENGFVVDDPADAGAVAGRLAALLDRDARSARREAALKTARAATWEATVEKVLTVYEEIRTERSTSKQT